MRPQKEKSEKKVGNNRYKASLAGFNYFTFTKLRLTQSSLVELVHGLSLATEYSSTAL
jgi:hypothetical protein